MKRTTIFLPNDLHDRLREEAFRSRISMAQLIRSRLERNLRRPRKSKGDPLLRVVGICSGPPPSHGIDEELYGI